MHASNINHVINKNVVTDNRGCDKDLAHVQEHSKHAQIKCEANCILVSKRILE